MAITGAVYARIVSQYSDKGSKAAQRDIQKTAAKIDQFNRRIVKSYALAAAAAAAFAVKIGKDAVMGAAADEKQQASLAIALRNTAGATDEAIRANQKYLDSLELQVAIDNEELIPALQKLVTATGDLAAGQYLLTLATDVAAASGKDLSTVSTALSRAVMGNYTALNKLGLPLDQAAIKAKDFAKIQKQLADLSKGQAAAAANTFSGTLEKLRLRFNQVLDSLGYALMPMIEKYANYIITDVIPNIEEWVKLNEEKLVDSFKSIIEILDSFAKNFLAILLFVEKYRVLIGVIAAIPFISLISSQVLFLGAVARKGGKFLEGLWKMFKTRLLPVLSRFGVVAGAVGTVFTTGGFGLGMRALFSALTKAIKPLGIAVTLVTALGAAYKGLMKIFGGDSEDKLTKSLSAQAEAGRTALRVNRMSRAELKKKAEAEKAAAAAAAKAAAAAAKAAKVEKDRAKFEADYAKLNDKLAKRAGARLLSSEDEKMVQINAAIALADRQKEINKLDKERLERMKEELISLKVRNDLASRYQDILKALADTKIDDKELVVLAKIWDVPVEAAKTYIETLLSIEDAEISDDEIIKLAMSWGSTQDQAAKYLDFYQYLNDGFLSDSEIEKLRAKWGMTENQVKMYADFVGIVNDGKLNDAEIIKIQGKWKLTTDQVIEYIKQIGAPVSYSGTLVDPAKAAEIGWKDAKTALQAYLDLLKAGTGAGVTGAPAGTVNGNDPAVIAAAIAAANEAAKAAADAAAIAAEAEAAAAAADAAAAAASGIFLNAIREAKTTDAVNAAVQVAQVVGESASDIANAMMVGLLGQGMDAATAGSSARYTGMAIAAQQAAEAKAKADAEALARALSSGQVRSRDMELGGFSPISSADYDERFRFNAFSQNSTLNTAKGINTGNLMAAPVINITVQGSVTAEQDLVQTVRNGLLATQYNGNQLLLEAI